MKNTKFFLLLTKKSSAFSQNQLNYRTSSITMSPT